MVNFNSENFTVKIPTFLAFPRLFHSIRFSSVSEIQISSRDVHNHHALSQAYQQAVTETEQIAFT